MQANGGGGGPAAGMPVGPTPAGHQAELNLIYGMVEELSRQLSDNRRVTEDIVSGLGRVRNRARERNLANDEVLGEASNDLLSQELNLDQLVSVLTEALDRAKLSRDSNFSLLTHYARVLSNILGQFHEFKQRHIADVSAWHRSYRQQLAESRAENERLREQIWDMQEHAGRANDMLRQFRKTYDEDVDRWRTRIDDRAQRQEIRFWKRMAMPDVPDTAEDWSDDDDMVDPVEKERLIEAKRQSDEHVAHGLGSGSSQQSDESEGDVMGTESLKSSRPMGGVAMERDSSNAMSNPPPRPSSTGSTQGRAG